jgi:hypothetical protein
LPKKLMHVSPQDQGFPIQRSPNGCAASSITAGDAGGQFQDGGHVAGIAGVVHNLDGFGPRGGAGDSLR